MSDSLSPRDWASHPAYRDPGYKSTGLRGPTQPLVTLPAGIGELSGPRFGKDFVFGDDADLTRNGRVNGEPQGERIIVTGRVMDENGRAVPDTLVEVWQANAAGRYVHSRDQHDAPLDPNFLGAGRCATDADGVYRFLTVKPGAYPWPNHFNAWRPNHIHLSLFGPGFGTRLVTQMYFPGDPLLDLDPIFKATPEPVRTRLVADFDIEVTQEAYALGYRFDIVLRGSTATPMEG
ncbi:MAG: protocatechuate 3,4-dioxygenase subunit beta [Alphaproteobacteria bacterium]